jgi:hypothetical protein
MIAVRSEPSIYRRYGPHSYFADILFRGPDALERLRRHAVELEMVWISREAAARRRFRAAGIEYRVEPGLLQGHGGYFTPPLWVVDQFATSNRPHRVLADLIRAKFPMPRGVSSISVPAVLTGTQDRTQLATAPVPSADMSDAARTSVVATISGEADVALQALEQSPPDASFDWALFTDLGEAVDAQIETQLLAGLGANYQQILGVANVPGITSVTYTSGAPSQSGMWPYIGQLMAQFGDNRSQPPEVFLARTARWGWLMSGYGTDNIPFGVLSPNYLASMKDTPNPIGALFGLPVYPDDAIPVVGGQDTLFALRPSDFVLFEGLPSLNVYRDVTSGSLTGRVQLHLRAAAITSRRPASIGVLSGTGLTIAGGY